MPGLCLVGVLVGAGHAIHHWTGSVVLAPLFLSLVFGLAVGILADLPQRTAAGVAFARSRLLRLGVVLMGLQVTFGQIAEIGFLGLAVIAAIVAASFQFTRLAARLIGVDRRLAELIAAGTSICGASAIIGVDTVTRGRAGDVPYAIACITIFGTLSMLAFPLLSGLLGLDARHYGLWAGSAIHEVGQAVAAACLDSAESGYFGAIAKLARVAMLAPLILLLALGARSKGRRADNARVPVPWFVAGFVGLVGLNSIGALPPAVAALGADGSRILLAMALAAIGLEIDLRALAGMGLRPLLLGGASWLFISGFSLILIVVLL
ncbi:putative sulfate exporter family transporter [Oleomonas cavernae]|uniref:Putative sulfate exporter family transporter n=1 Tax=Oleomonas cavernae TaxID=2320859 RepID=A0A418WK24_9PROT|nr:putative sulfate exporter family transporter [Oleomonas cavernae]